MSTQTAKKKLSKKTDEIEEQEETAETQPDEKKDREKTAMTERDRAAIGVLKKQQTSVLSAVTKTRNKLAVLMGDRDNLHLVKTALNKLNSHYQDYQDAHTEYCEALPSQEQKDKQTEHFEWRQNSGVTFRRTVMDWVNQSEQALDRVSHTSTSKSGRRKSEVASLGSLAQATRAQLH